MANALPISVPTEVLRWLFFDPLAGGLSLDNVLVTAMVTTILPTDAAAAAIKPELVIPMAA